MSTIQQPAASDPYAMPHSVESEQGILGCILLDPAESLRRLDEFCAERNVHPGPLFFVLPHRQLFDLLLQMHASGLVIDMITVWDAIKVQGLEPSIGGLQQLAALQDATPSASHISHYLQLVLEKYSLREAQVALEFALGKVIRQESVHDIAQTLHIRTFEKQDDPPMHELARRAADAIEERFSPNTKYIQTGIRSLDRILGGVGPEYVLIAARPSMGKSSFGINLAYNVALKYPQRRVGFITLEMTPEEITTRMIDLDSRLATNRYPEFTEDDHKERARSVAKIGKLPILIHSAMETDFRKAVRPDSIMAICAKMKQWVRENDIAAIVVDYLGRIGGRTERDDEYTSISYASKMLSIAATKLGIPLFVCGQLNRDAEDEKPSMQHLRGSGTIENDAHKVLLLHSNQNGKRVHMDTVEATIIVAKNRGGATGEASALFHRYCGLWDDPLLPPI
jgi:replicative DNA helicase